MAALNNPTHPTDVPCPDCGKLDCSADGKQCKGWCLHDNFVPGAGGGGFGRIVIERTTGTPAIIDQVEDALAKRQVVRLGRFIAEGDPLGKGCGADLYAAPNTPDGRAFGKGYTFERYTAQPFRAVAAFFVHRWLRDW
jgi:hypothetical protein